MLRLTVTRTDGRVETVVVDTFQHFDHDKTLRADRDGTGWIWNWNHVFSVQIEDWTAT